MSKRDFSDSKFNQGVLFRHLHYRHYNGTDISIAAGQQLNNLSGYINDAAAAIGGVQIGEFYKLTAANPYGMRAGTVVERLS